VTSLPSVLKQGIQRDLNEPDFQGGWLANTDWKTAGSFSSVHSRPLKLSDGGGAEKACVFLTEKGG